MPQADPRRQQAARLFETGATQAEVARRIGVSRATAMRWHRLWSDRGRRGLLQPAPRGRICRLNREQMQAVDAALCRPPADSGVDGEDWSLASVTVVIEQLTGVRYHRRHVGRLLRRIGWVIPPVGKHAGDAMRAHRLVDPDGNGILLFERP